jgi:hypothetical protein
MMDDIETYWQKEDVTYGVTVDLEKTPTVFSDYATAYNQAAGWRENPLYKNKPVFIVERIEHYEVVCKMIEEEKDV